MTTSKLRLAILAGLFLGAAALAGASEPISNLLSVRHIVTPPGGPEIRLTAAEAKPGDVLEYVAEFRNNGAAVAHGLSATLPLPAGTEFVSGSARPAGARASVDGVSFDALPLKRLVKLANGSSHEELIPVSEYRYLRWPAADLAASSALSVSARVTIAAAKGP